MPHPDVLKSFRRPRKVEEHPNLRGMTDPYHLLHHPSLQMRILDMGLKQVTHRDSLNITKLLSGAQNQSFNLNYSFLFLIFDITVGSNKFL